MMSVTASYLERTGRSAKQDEYGSITYGASYRVEVSTSEDGPKRVLAQAVNAAPDPIPGMCDKYKIGTDRDNNAYCLSRDVEQHNENKLTWYRVRCEWRPFKPGESNRSLSQPPMNRPVNYWIEHATYSELITVDKDGEPLLNTAVCEFDEPLQGDVSYMILVAVKNYATLQEIINLNLNYSMTVNKDRFHGASERQVLCHPITCSEQITEGAFKYYRATFHFEYHPQTWTKWICNRGYKYLDGTGKLVTAKDNSVPPIPVNEPVLLADDGTRLPDNTMGFAIPFNIYQERNFRFIGV